MHENRVGTAANCIRKWPVHGQAVIIGPNVAKAATSGPGVATISELVMLTMHILSFVLGSSPCEITSQLLSRMGVRSAGGTDHMNTIVISTLCQVCYRDKHSTHNFAVFISVYVCATLLFLWQGLSQLVHNLRSSQNS